MTDQRPAETRRETRLLLVTIAVSVGMLLLLARFRFPDTGQTAEPAPAPLERLAARATYDELAAVMADLERRISPAVVPLGTQGDDGVRYIPAVRVTPDRAVALLPRDRRLMGSGSAPAPPIVLRNPATELIVVQIPADPAAVPALPASLARPGPRYLAVAEAMSGASAIRPVYVGRTELSSDPRWPDSVLSVAAVQQTLPQGAAVFSLDGTFLGLASERSGRVTVIPATTLRSAAAGTLAAPAARSDLPLDVQPLTAILGKAAGADKGVMISHVRGPGSDLASGDVIQSIDGTDITTVAGYQQVAQSRTPGAEVTLRILRRGEPLAAKVRAIAADDAETAGTSQQVGAVLRVIRDAGAEVMTVDPASAAQRAGLRGGDLIVAIDGAPRPNESALNRAFQKAKPGAIVLLTIRRDGDHRVLALEKR